MNKYVSVDSPIRKYGHWFMMPNGMSLFSSRPPDENHVHYELMQQEEDLSGSPSVAMHEFPVLHENNKYKIENDHIDYDNLKELAKKIRSFLKKNHAIKSGSNGSENIKTMKFGATNLSGILVGNSDKTFFLIQDANNQTVMATLRKNREDSQHSIEKMLDDVSEYLAHEHHRAALSVSGKTLCSYAPDHICFNESPLKYWPNSKLKTIYSSPIYIGKKGVDQ